MADLPYFISTMDEILNKLTTDELYRNCDANLLGDMNMDLLKSGSHEETSQYLESLLSGGQLPLISFPTRLGNNSATLIDHISTSHRSDHYDAGILISSVSDHFPIFYVQSSHHENIKSVTFKTRKINPGTEASFLNLISSKSWQDITNENRPNVAFGNFFNTIDAAAELSFPETEVNVKSKRLTYAQWMTVGLITSRYKKEKVFSLKVRNPTTKQKQI